MNRLAARTGVVLLLVVLFVLRHDFWFWGRSDRVFGLPVGLAFHLFYCLLIAGSMALLVRFAWPADLDSDETLGDGTDRSSGATRR